MDNNSQAPTPDPTTSVAVDDNDQSPSPEPARDVEELDTRNEPAPQSLRTEDGRSVLSNRPPPQEESEQPAEQRAHPKSEIRTTATAISDSYPVRVGILRNLNPNRPPPRRGHIHPVELVHSLRWQNSRRQLMSKPWRLECLERIRLACQLPIFLETNPKFVIAAILKDLCIGFFAGALLDRVCVTNILAYPGSECCVWPRGEVALRLAIKITSNPRLPPRRTRTSPSPDDCNNGPSRDCYDLSG